MTREEAIMENDSQKAKKIKTPFAKMIVEGNQEKPYFSILYFDPIDKDFYVGYSSYCLDYVFNWLNEEFEIVEDENFIIAALRPVSREQVEKVWRGEWIAKHYVDGILEGTNFDECSKCGYQRVFENPELKTKYMFCPGCGRAMWDEAVEMVMERLEALYGQENT